MDALLHPDARSKSWEAPPWRCIVLWGIVVFFLPYPTVFAQSHQQTLPKADPALSADEGARDESARDESARDESARDESARDESARRILGEAIQFYQHSDFDSARKLLQQLLSRIGTSQTRVAQEAFTYMAFVHVAFNEQDLAVAAFEHALSIQPNMTLRSPSPRILAALEQARQRYRAKIRALDHDPPQQTHAPIQAVNYNTSLLISNIVTDLSGVKRVVLHYRVKGLRGFSSVEMEQGKRGLFIATIPASSVMRPGVEYYLEAWDVLGNGPGLKGSPALPIQINVEGGPAAQERATADRWYKKWWFWAIVSGAALTAGAATAIPYLARDETARIEVRLNLNKPTP